MARLDMASAEHLVDGQSATGDILYQLGVMYATGRSVGQDLVAAHKWFNLAAARGNREAIRHRQEIAGEMSAAEVAEAQRLAREWVRTH
jgi:TPR repeat protein